jgi:microsomal prostaglandin-E synthase 2|tara:strand:+ start:777 stop:1508 length:732 start_codon:yes stop_codon:yes gene_type:complete
MSKGESGIQPTKVPEKSVDNKPTIYTYATCPFSLKVKSLLKSRGIEFSNVEVDPMKKTELKWSDWRKVPVFVDVDGTHVNDSNDILHYIDEKHGNKFPREGEDSEQDKWMNFSNDILGKSILPVIYNSYSSSRDALRYVADVESFTRFQKWKSIWLGGIIMRMVGKSRGKMFDLPPEENLTHQLTLLSEGFTGDFFGGDSPNGADFANYGILRSMQGLRGWNIVESHAKAGPWFARMQTTTGV